MEITIKDLQYFNISPTLISIIKAINSKDDEFLLELHKVSDIKPMLIHLEKLNFIKILDCIISYEAIEIRSNKVIDYLNQNGGKSVDIARQIFDYFIEVIEKYSNKKSRLDFKTYREFLKGRVNQGVSLENAKSIIDKKFKEWYDNPNYRQHLNFQTLLGSKHYSQYVQQLDVDDEVRNIDLNITKA